MTKYIAVISGKGGVGKTTTAINLASAMHDMGRDTIVFDANITTPNVNVHLGSPKLPKTIHDAMHGKIKITEAIYKHKSGVKVIPASLELEDLRKLDVSKLRSVIQDLEGHADVIFLDCGAGMGGEAVVSLECSDEVLIVTNPDLPSVTSATKAAQVANDLKKIMLGVCVTKVIGDKYEMNQKQIEEMMEQPVIAMVPYDHAIRKALQLKYPVVLTHPNSPSSQQYKILASKMLGLKYEYYLEKNPWLRLLAKLGIKIKR
ncbi:cell division ATPase MinD [Candidatus Woesearchaeota archaeon]|nr:cell division ATPase MinD [Candidatus Woesearchaeota archaeon]